MSERCTLLMLGYAWFLPSNGAEPCSGAEGKKAVEGEVPRRALRHVLEWYERHRDQLQRNWELAQNHEPPVKVPPLE